MNITRISNWSGKQRTVDLNITPEQYARYKAGEFVQNAFPHLNADEREFILTGMTPDEWEEMCREED